MSEYYKLPEGIRQDMGGYGEKIDNRLQEVLNLLQYAPHKKGKVLDIGVGRGRSAAQCWTGLK